MISIDTLNFRYFSFTLTLKENKGGKVKRMKKKKLKINRGMEQFGE